MIKKIILALWNYITQMNTGTNGKLSINRNMAWGIASLLVFVEIYSLWRLPIATDNQIALFIKICITYAIIDATFVTLALGITSVEKLNELAKTLKGDFFKKEDPKLQDKKPAEQVPQVIVNTQTEVTTQQS